MLHDNARLARVYLHAYQSRAMNFASALPQKFWITSSAK